MFKTPRLLLVAGEKGGTGKTTTAVSLAILRRQAGRDVLLIDADKQQSAAMWSARRSQLDQALRVQCITLYGSTLANEVRALAPRYDDIVLDVGGYKSVEFVAALSVADRLITPIKASQFDIDTMKTVDELVGLAKGMNPDLDATWFVNMASTNVRSSALADTRAALADLINLRPLTAALSHRTAFEAAASGTVPTEASKRDKKACTELLNLYLEAWQ